MDIIKDHTDAIVCSTQIKQIPKKTYYAWRKYPSLFSCVFYLPWKNKIQLNLSKSFEERKNTLPSKHGSALDV